MATEIIEEKPFAAKVEALAGYGISAADIAIVLSMDEQELRATYATELEGGHIKANARVAESLFRRGRFATGTQLQYRSFIDAQLAQGSMRFDPLAEPPPEPPRLDKWPIKVTSPAMPCVLR